MGHSSTPTYRVEYDVRGGARFTPMAWAMGAPSDKSLAAHVAAMQRSFASGGPNHLVTARLGRAPEIVAAKVIRQKDNEVVAEWQAVYAANPTTTDDDQERRWGSGTDLVPAAEQLVSLGVPKTLDGAKTVIRTWLKARGFKVDRWANYIEEEGKLRWKIRERVLQRQSRLSAGDWVTIRSWTLLDAAQNLVQRAARQLGREDVLTKTTAAKGKRRTAAEKRVESAQRAREEKDTRTVALKLVAWDHPEEILPAAQKRGSVREALGGRIASYVRDMPPGAREFDDAAVASAARPPLLPLFTGDVKYRWDEVYEGVPYTIRIDPMSWGEATIHIGASGGRLQVDPSRHVVEDEPEGVKGDAHAAGVIEVDDETGEANAKLFLVGASEKRRGGGSRVLGIWCQLMGGYGVRRWLAEAVGDEGLAFLRGLERKGVIEFRGTKGNYHVIECVDPKQLRLFAKNPTMTVASVAKAVARMTTDTSSMTAGKINAELDRLDEMRSYINQQFIDAGRGHERPSETGRMTDPLALAANALSSRQFDLRTEIERRYGPGAPSRLPRGFGPIANPVANPTTRGKIVLYVWPPPSSSSASGFTYEWDDKPERFPNFYIENAGCFGKPFGSIVGDDKDEVRRQAEACVARVRAMGYPAVAVFEQPPWTMRGRTMRPRTATT